MGHIGTRGTRTYEEEVPAGAGEHALDPHDGTQRVVVQDQVELLDLKLQKVT